MDACASCRSGSMASPLVNCSACRAVVYCGPRCQRAHWRVHKGDCKETAKVRFESALAAANAGDNDAEFDVGVCYAFGHGAVKDAMLAATWYRRAAEAGHAYAQFNLGVMLLKG